MRDTKRSLLETTDFPLYFFPSFNYQLFTFSLYLFPIFIFVKALYLKIWLLYEACKFGREFLNREIEKERESLGHKEKEENHDVNKPREEKKTRLTRI